MIGIGLSTRRIFIESFVLLVNYLQKGSEKVSWQMMVVIIGHVLTIH
jgi:hypothetical protein